MLAVSRPEEQEERFAESAAILKRWKLSRRPRGGKNAEYGRARDTMFKATHTKPRLVRR
jgi:polyphosphate kinase 2 (PPK2 family)